MDSQKRNRQWIHISKSNKDYIRCEALVNDSYNRPTNERCCHIARVWIDGHNLCHKHAGPYALELALKECTALPIVAHPAIKSTIRFSRHD